MKTAVDASVLLDILSGNNFSEKSEKALLKARTEGALIVCDMVVSEISPALKPSEVQDFLSDLSCTFVPSTLKESLLAGVWFKSYLQRGGKPGRILPDFIIAAHAHINSARVLTRDQGFKRKEFSEIKIIWP